MFAHRLVSRASFDSMLGDVISRHAWQTDTDRSLVLARSGAASRASGKLTARLVTRRAALPTPSRVLFVATHH